MRLKRAVSAFIISALLVSAAPLCFAAAPEVSAAACVVCDAETGTVVYEKNASRQLPIASTTKLMTALVALENLSANEKITIKREWAAVEGSSMGLREGEECSVRELLYGLLLASGNDAGLALACHAAGSVEAFAALMNDKAAELGMEGTHFTNPHGLDDAEHYSTARDMALLAAACLKEPELALIVSTREARLTPQRYYSNHNRLLWECEGCIGLKTGYTSRAGRTLVSACEREGTRLICVTLCDPCDWADHKALYDWAFDNYRTLSFGAENTEYSLPLVSGVKDSLRVTALGAARVFASAADEVELRENLPRFVYAPMKQGDRVGSVEIFVNGEKRARLALVAAEDAPLAEGATLNFWEQIRWSWQRANEYNLVGTAW